MLRLARGLILAGMIWFLFLVNPTPAEVDKSKVDDKVIDNSAAFRLDEDVPLLVPEVNGHVLGHLEIHGRAHPLTPGYLPLGGLFAPLDQLAIESLAKDLFHPRTDHLCVGVGRELGGGLEAAVLVEQGV